MLETLRRVLERHRPVVSARPPLGWAFGGLGVVPSIGQCPSIRSLYPNPRSPAMALLAPRSW